MSNNELFIFLKGVELLLIVDIELVDRGLSVDFTRIQDDGRKPRLVRGVGKMLGLKADARMAAVGPAAFADDTPREMIPV